MKQFFKALGWVLVFALLMAVLMISGLWVAGKLISSSALFAVVSEAIGLVAALIISWIIYRFIKHKPLRNIGFSKKSAGWDILHGFIVALLIYGIGFGLSVIAGWIKVESVSATTRGVTLGFIFFLLTALFEELVMRGLILGELMTCTNKYIALALSSVIFSLGHFFNPSISAISFFNIFLAGLTLGSVYIFTKSLWFGISIHFFWNYFQDLLGYSVSGNSFASALELSRPGNRLLTGGDFGFEGSIICTILLMITTTVIIAAYINKKKKTEAENI
jgi:uncharacterized protein